MGRLGHLQTLAKGLWPELIKDSKGKEQERSRASEGCALELRAGFDHQGNRNAK